MTYQNQLPVNIPDFDDEDRRFYAACAAMQGIISGPHIPNRRETAKIAVEFADALLKQLDDGGE